MSSSTFTKGMSLVSMESFVSTFHHFTTPISLKLFNDNFLLWKQQVLATVDGLLLTKYLDNYAIHPYFLFVADGFSTCSNHAYSFYK